MPISRPIFLPTRCATSASTNSSLFLDLIESLLNLKVLWICTCGSSLNATSSFLDLDNNGISSERTRVTGFQFVDFCLD